MEIFLSDGKSFKYIFYSFNFIETGKRLELNSRIEPATDINMHVVWWKHVFKFSRNSEAFALNFKKILKNYNLDLNSEY